MVIVVLNIKAPSQALQTDSEPKWGDDLEVREYRQAKQQRWSAENENRVFDTNDPQLDLAHIHHH